MTQSEQLIQWFKGKPKAYLLFSGGFDSSAVLGAAMQAKADLMPIWIDNGFNRAVAEDMEKQARNLGASNLKVVKVKPEESVLQNTEKRCYYCKGHILSLVPSDANLIIDGTTASDLGNYRPGKQALDEYHVKSPLAELKIVSNETKGIAIGFGADPHLADLESCLATRINYGNSLSPERIKAIYKIENYLIDKTGDYHVRCRIDDADHLRIEFAKTESYQALADPQFREELFNLGAEVSLFVTVDMKRSRPTEYDKRIVKK